MNNTKIVDSAEPEIIRRRMLELGWQQARLATGDYSFTTCNNHKVGIERKAVDDLMNSLGDRLARQLEVMLDCYDINILLLEGSWRTIYDKGNIITNRGISYYTRTMVWNYLRRWQDKGITLELTTDEGMTISRINELYALYMKPYSLSSKSREFSDDRILALPSGLRGRCGMNVLQEFGSLQAVSKASREELLQVRGIGEQKADLIIQHFSRVNSNA